MGEAVMTHETAIINCLMNLKNDMGKSRYCDLWHYEQAIDEAIEIIDEMQRQKNTPPTNADRIRAMTNSELSKWFCHNRGCERCEFNTLYGCTLLDWLET